MASGIKINIYNFEEYCLKTAKMFVTLYPWYYMPSSVHKVLIHGADVIRFAPLPIGNIIILFMKKYIIYKIKIIIHFR